MNIFLYISIFIIIIGISAILIMLYLLFSHRENEYDVIMKEHKEQIERIKKKINNNGGKR